jgi:hypothetical protein
MLALSPFILKLAFVLAIVPLAGCISDEALGASDLLSAHYRINDSHGLIGHYNLSLDPQMNPWTMVIEVNLVPHDSEFYSSPGRAYNLTATLDPATGQLLNVHQPYFVVEGGFQDLEEPMVRFPLGNDQLIPHPDDSAPGTGFTDENQLTYIHEVVPFSLQWPLAAGSDVWGDLFIESRALEAGWEVNGTADCHRDCWYQDDGLEQFYVFMEGQNGRILPDFMKWGRVGDDGSIWATLMESKGDELELSPREPHGFETSEINCGLLPCEPANWPSRLSFQYAFDFLELTPQWIAWSTGKDVSFLSGFQGPSDPTGDQLSAAEPILWSLKFVDRDTGLSKRFSMISLRVDGDSVSPPVVYREGDETLEFQFEYSPFAEWRGVGLNEAFDWLALAGRTVDEIEFVNLFSHAERLAPDPSFQLRVTLGVGGGPGVKWVAGSGYSGELLEFGPF